MTLKEKKGMDGHTNEHTNLVTTSLLELLIAAKNIKQIKSIVNDFVNPKQIKML